MVVQWCGIWQHTGLTGFLTSQQAFCGTQTVPHHHGASRRANKSLQVPLKGRIVSMRCQRACSTVSPADTVPSRIKA